MMNGLIKSLLFAQKDTVSLPKNNLDPLNIGLMQTASSKQNGSQAVIYKREGIIPESIMQIDSIKNQPIFMNIQVNDKSLIDDYNEVHTLSLNQDSNCYIVNKEHGNVNQQINLFDTKEERVYSNKNFAVKEKLTTHNDWTIIPILLGLFLLASIVNRYRKYLVLLLESIVYRFSNSKILNEKNSQIFRLTIVLDILYVLSFSLTVDQIAKKLELFSTPDKFPYIIFIACLFFFIILRLFRLSVFKLSAIFSNNKIFFKELFNGSLLYTRALGLFLLPLVILVTYSIGLFNLILIYFTLFTIFIILIMRLISMFQTFILRGFSIFYFILYLCALEIVPLLILWKEVKSR